MKSKYNYTNTFLNPGDKVFLITYNNLVIPSTVLQTIDFYEGLTAYKFLNQEDNYILITTGEKDENGWDKDFQSKDFSLLESKKHYTQFLSLDEPTFGHDVCLGDTYDGCFLTLEDALENINPSNKKHLKRRLSEYRKRSYGFVKWTHKRAQYNSHLEVPDHPMKKVYVRKK